MAPRASGLRLGSHLAVALVFAAAPLLGGPPSVDDAAAVRFRLLNEALAQAERPSADWDPGQRDCAGFVRFLFRKSTLARAAVWTRRDGTKSPYLRADELLAYNFTPLSRAVDEDRAETGDPLAFYDPEKPPLDAWHLMVVLRPPGTAPDRLLVVYHNGALAPDGTVRKVWLDDLVTGPAVWRPVPENPRFLGTFRWNGFGGASEHQR